MGYCLCSYLFGWLRDKEDKTFQWNLAWEVVIEIWDWEGCPLETSDRVEIWMSMGGDGVPNLLIVLTVLVYRRVLVRVGLLSLPIFYMILVMRPRWSFGKTVGVERHLLQLATLACSDFARIRRLVWLSLWNPPMVPFFGMWVSLGVCMFGN